jgi:hypothetical protein
MSPIPIDIPWSLRGDAFGRLVLTQPGQADCPVTPIRAFPLEAPDAGIALVDAQGHERVWISHLDQVPEGLRIQVRRALLTRDFMPVIEAITGISSTATPCTWTLKTDRGDRTLTLRSEHDIRRLSDGQLLIADSDGLSYVVRDIKALDRASRRLLDHFL